MNAFRYLYVGLPGLNADDYRHGDNWLGVALSALMRCPKDRIVEWGAEAMRRIGAAPLSDRRKMLLGECVEGYIPLPQEEVDRLADILNQNATGRVPPMNKTSFMKGKEEGVELGRRKGAIEFLEAQLATKFGPLPAASLCALRALPDADLARIGLAILTAPSLADLGL